MVLVSIAVVALRQLTDRLGACAGSVLERAGQALGVIPHDLVRATRRAWRALEIALSGQPILEHLAGFFPRGQATVFREQIEVLLEMLDRAGLECDDPDVCRDCVKELRSARRGSLLTRENGRERTPQQLQPLSLRTGERGQFSSLRVGEGAGGD